MGMHLVVGGEQGPAGRRVSRRRIEENEFSADIMVAAQAIALEWGLKSPKDAVEAVFRKYAHEYMYGRRSEQSIQWPDALQPNKQSKVSSEIPIVKPQQSLQDEVKCEAMSELDDLLGL